MWTNFIERIGERPIVHCWRCDSFYLVDQPNSRHVITCVAVKGNWYSLCEVGSWCMFSLFVEFIQRRLWPARTNQFCYFCGCRHFRCRRCRILSDHPIVDYRISSTDLGRAAFLLSSYLIIFKKVLTAAS